MNKVHRALLAHIRSAAPKQPDVASHQSVCAAGDIEALRLLFANYRGGADGRGLRLTRAGLTVMRLFFESHKIDLPENTVLTPRVLMYFDAFSAMPYFHEGRRLVLFDGTMAAKLLLAGNHLDLLLQMDGAC